MAVGIKEIAQDLNLGLSTVAQALAGKGTISPRTRQLVFEHAAKVGYTANRNAQRMRSGRTGVIGLVVPDVVLSPYVEVVQYLFREVEEQGKELQIGLTEFNKRLEDRAIKSMVASRVDGLIVKVGFAKWSQVPENHYLRNAKSAGIPIVLYSNPIEGIDIPYMKHPLAQSVRLVVRHLIERGHRRIAALVPAAAPFGTSMQGWLAAIREELAVHKDISVEFEAVGLRGEQVTPEGPIGVFHDYMNQGHPQQAVPAGRELFRNAMEKGLTAMVAYSDPVAIGAVYEAQSQGLKVGSDVAIAGCGQVASSFLCPISLTTVDRNPRLYARKLLNLLAQHSNEATRANAPLFDEIEPVLVEGESTIGR